MVTAIYQALDVNKRFRINRVFSIRVVLRPTAMIAVVVVQVTFSSVDSSGLALDFGAYSNLLHSTISIILQFYIRSTTYFSVEAN